MQARASLVIYMTVNSIDCRWSASSRNGAFISYTLEVVSRSADKSDSFLRLVFVSCASVFAVSVLRSLDVSS